MKGCAFGVDKDYRWMTTWSVLILVAGIGFLTIAILQINNKLPNLWPVNSKLDPGFFGLRGCRSIRIFRRNCYKHLRIFCNGSHGSPQFEKVAASFDQVSNSDDDSDSSHDLEGSKEDDGIFGSNSSLLIQEVAYW